MAIYLTGPEEKEEENNMTLYMGTGAGWFNPWGAVVGYFIYIAYVAATNSNAYPIGSLGNF